jgi:enoyl-CoA hydratase
MSVDDRVLTVVLNRPERRNALTTRTLEELAEVFEGADRRDDVDAVVLTGADPAFCAGVDLGELEATGKAPGARCPFHRSPSRSSARSTVRP